MNNWNVLNLACSSATIQNGLLGVQVLGDGQVAPPQLAEAERATHAKVIIVSVGADDVEWSIMTRLCVASAVCNDKVSTAYFNQLLSAFTRSYYQLLGDLAGLPGSPAVLVNEYYSPFGPNIGCLARYGLTAAKEKVLLARLGQLNTVLAEGAQTFGFGVADPPFTGHELCTADPYVQGPGDPAPLHPTATGELAIALADQQELPKLAGPGADPGRVSLGRHRRRDRRGPDTSGSAWAGMIWLAVGGQGVLLLVVHQVHGELVGAGLGQLAQPVHVRGRRAEQAEPVHDLVRHEVHVRVVGLAVVRVVVALRGPRCSRSARAGPARRCRTWPPGRRRDCRPCRRTTAAAPAGAAGRCPRRRAPRRTS